MVEVWNSDVQWFPQDKLLLQRDKSPLPSSEPGLVFSHTGLRLLPPFAITEKKSNANPSSIDWGKGDNGWSL